MTEDKVCKDVFTARMAAILSCSGVEGEVSAHLMLTFRLVLLAIRETVAFATGFVYFVSRRVVLRVVVAITANASELYYVTF